MEIGINLGTRNLVEIQYYLSSDKLLDPNLRAGFLSALESFTTEVFGDDINVVSLASYKLVCYCEMVSLPDPGKNQENTQPLLYYAIIEKDTDPVIVKNQLKEINLHFLNRFPLNSIFSKKKKFFNKFHERIDDLLGDLKLKTEDRFRSLF